MFEDLSSQNTRHRYLQMDFVISVTNFVGQVNCFA